MMLILMKKMMITKYMDGHDRYYDDDDKILIY